MCRNSFFRRGTLVVLAAFSVLPLRAQEEDASKARVLFMGTRGGRCGFEVARRLDATGFILQAMPHPGLTGAPLTREQVKDFHVLVVAGLGLSNADMSLGDTRQTVEVLNRFLARGGGLFVFGVFGQQATAKPPLDALLIPLGLTPLFD